MRLNNRPVRYSAWLACGLLGCVGHMEGTGDPSGNPGGPGGGSGDDVGGDTNNQGSDETIDTIDCPAGQGPLWELSADLDASGFERFSSGVRTGTGGPPMTLTCGVTGCADGEVGVEVADNPLLDRGEITSEQDLFTNSTTILCVAAPPACGAGTTPFYVGSVPDPNDTTQQTGGFWSCSTACEVVVNFGGLYGYQAACTVAPPSCGGADAATFTFETQEWECSPMCDGGLYDPVTFEGATVCVPC